MVMRNTSILIVLCALLSGCLTSSRVQADYKEQRDECRVVADRNAGQFHPQQAPSEALAMKGKNAVLAKIFSDCMYINGWAVAAPSQKSGPPRVIAGGKPELDQLTASSMKRPAPAPTYVTPSTPLPANRQMINQPRQ
jgi:hypothetical protein